jgi:hypothetical protein
MHLFMVVPEFTNVLSFRALAGWRVFTTLGAAIEEIEERYSERKRKFSGLARGSDAVPIFTEIEDDLFSTTLFPDQVKPLEPILQRPLRGWRRVTLAYYEGWLVQDQMLGGAPKRWKFKKHWEPLLASSEPGPRVIMKR